MPTRAFPRHISILILAALACSFAGNHIAARIAFDSGAGLLLAILFRSGGTALALAVVVCWRRESFRIAREVVPWQLLVGLLVGVQSFCIYSAVARIPVGLALLVVNLAPVFLALLTWALGGAVPTRRAALLMGGILCGLLIVLDIPTILSSSGSLDELWIEGVVFSLVAAAVFAVAMWISDRHLAQLPGTLRSMLTMVVVFLGVAMAGSVGVFPGGLSLPEREGGWGALVLLVLLYGVGFSMLFICMPRLDIARNAPVMNVEPVAGLLLGWLILGQQVGGLQLAGGAIVIACIVMLAYRR